MNSERKKILYVITKSNWGGAQRYVYDLATSMPKSGYEVTVALGGNGVLARKLKDAKIRVVNIPHLERDVKFLSDVKVLFGLVRLFVYEKPHIVHLNSSKIGGLGAFAGRITRVPKIIFTAHGWAFNEPRGILSRNLIKLLSWMTLVFSHKIITVSKKDYSQAIKMPAAKDKVSLVHNGVKIGKPMDRDKARETLLGKKSAKLSDHRWVGTIAELTKNKGLEYSIKAFAEKEGHSSQDDKTVYVIIGNGEDKYRLTNLIKQLGLTKKVFLVVYEEGASTLLKAFDVFLLPSLKEGLPYVLLESGSIGLPTIATNVGGIPEIITDMESGILVRPKDSTEIHKALSFLMTDEKRMKMLGGALKKHVKENFTTAKMVEATIKVYGA